MKSASDISTRKLVLTVNGGSSSIKFALFEAGETLRRTLEGRIERIGLPEATFAVKSEIKADNFSRRINAPDHTAAVEVLMDWIEERFQRGELSRCAAGLADVLWAQRVDRSSGS